MRFTTVTINDAVRQASAAVKRAAGRDGNVTWFVSGGSCIEPEVQILNSLVDAELAKITVILADERYGEVGHADENYKKLRAAGFARPGLVFLPVLQPGMSLTETTEAYRLNTAKVLKSSVTIVATLGIGADGHTAGILPHSPAALDEMLEVSGYKAADFDRITMGAPLIRQIDIAHVFAYGSAKQNALTDICDRRGDIVDMPAQILYDLPNVTIYNDSIEGEV